MVRKLTLKAKYILVQVPVSIFAIWFGGWLAYHELELWRNVPNLVYMNILGLWMIIAVFMLLEIAKRVSLRGEHSGKMFCPACKQELTLNTELNPLKITYICRTKGCQLATPESKVKLKVLD